MCGYLQADICDDFSVFVILSPFLLKKGPGKNVKVSG